MQLHIVTHAESVAAGVMLRLFMLCLWEYCLFTNKDFSCV